MNFDEIIWKRQFVEKLDQKHGVSTDEVEEVFATKPLVRKVERGHIKGEDSYIAYGQTFSGRFLVVVFIRKGQGAVLPISARDMENPEKRYYEKQK